MAGMFSSGGGGGSGKGFSLPNVPWPGTADNPMTKVLSVGGKDVMMTPVPNIREINRKMNVSDSTPSVPLPEKNPAFRPREDQLPIVDIGAPSPENWTEEQWLAWEKKRKGQ